MPLLFPIFLYMPSRVFCFIVRYVRSQNFIPFTNEINGREITKLLEAPKTSFCILVLRNFYVGFKSEWFLVWKRVNHLCKKQSNFSFFLYGLGSFHIKWLLLLCNKFERALLIHRSSSILLIFPFDCHFRFLLLLSTMPAIVIVLAAVIS